MKKLKIAKSMPTSIIAALLVISVLALSIFAAVSYKPNSSSIGESIPSDPDGDGITATGVPVYIPEKRTYTRSEETYEGVQGIILRSAAANVNVSTISGTQVTDYVITSDASGAASAVSALEAAGINSWISVKLTGVSSSMLSTIKDIAASTNAYGIELDFCGMPCDPGSANSDVDTVTAFVGNVKDAIEPYGLKLSARVYSDINTNYGFGIDVAAWIANGYLDMITPSSGSEYTNTDMSIRLWTSLTDPYGVILAPQISGTIKNSESGTATSAQTKQTIAGEAAFAISHGADKVAVENYVDASMLNVIGSYDTVMKVDRVHHVTYNSTRQPWTPSHNQLPRSFSRSTTAIRIPMGNVPDNATVTVRITYNTSYFTNTNSKYASNYPTTVPSVTVYVNSQPCTYKGYVNGTEVKKTVSTNSFPFWDYVSVGYNATTYDYTVPKAALDAGYAVFELIPDSSTTLTISGIQLIVDVP